MKLSGDAKLSIKENSCGEEAMSIDGINMPPVIHRTAAEYMNNDKFSLGFHKAKLIFFNAGEKDLISHGEMPAVMDMTAMSSLVVGLP